MIDFLNSEFATLAVNLIVIFALLLFLFLGIKNVLPKIISDKFKVNLETSSTTQNIFTFVSVVVASTLLDLFSNGKYDMLWIVLVISILTIVFNFIYEKVTNTNSTIRVNEEYSRSLNLIEQIISCKGYGLIKNAKEIEIIEKSADEIYIFTENLITDIPAYEDTEIAYENSGLFCDIVSRNIPQGKKYIYFLKDTLINRNYFLSYTKCHFENTANQSFQSNISFYFIPVDDFCFFSEIYLYKTKDKTDKAFEWIPSLGEHKNVNKQFYLELSSDQTQAINEMICELIVSYSHVQPNTNVSYKNES